MFYILHVGRTLKYDINSRQCERSCYYASFIKPFVTYFRRPSEGCAISCFCRHFTNLCAHVPRGGSKHTSVDHQFDYCK